jgi:hypothetical protein
MEKQEIESKREGKWERRERAEKEGKGEKRDEE